MSKGLPDVTLQSTRHEVILRGLREVMSERQSTHKVNDINDPKWQEMYNIHILY